jgi:hypothetical protein
MKGLNPQRLRLISRASKFLKKANLGRWPRSRNNSWTCAPEIFRTPQFTTFYFFSRLFDTYSVPSNYVYAGLIQVSARIRSPT